MKNVKRTIKIILSIALISLIGVLAFANSGPVYWSWYPYSDIMVVDADSPIEVEGENLIFDFSKDDRSNHSYKCMVTAEYEMLNPTDEDLSVQMAFPFVEDINNISYDDIKIFAGNEKLSYEIFLGETANYLKDAAETQENNYDFKNIISTLSGDIYVAENFTENEIGKLYTIEVTTDSDDWIEIVLGLKFDPKSTKVFTSGFRGLDRNKEITKINASVREFDILELFVLGDDIDFDIEGYRDGTLQKKTDLYTYEISEKEEDLKSYLLERVRDYPYQNYRDTIDNIRETQIYNIFSKALDTEFTNNLGYCSFDELMAYGRVNRIITLVYSVEFPKKSSKTISVGYQTFGTMDRRYTAEALYTYEYILNPAENWKDFKNLSIKIIPPDNSPYIVDSNIDFQKENHVYTATMESLPDNDLTFTLYYKDKITFMDSIQAEFRRISYYIPIFIVLALLIVFPIIIVKIARGIRRLKSR